MRIVLIFCVLLVWFSNVTAQNISLEGTVKDSLNQPLAYANIIAKPKDVNKSMVFVITDEEGRYSVDLLANETYTIRVTYMGFEPEAFDFNANRNSVKNVTLKELNNNLKEVVIELPVSVKGDTITYKTNSFTNGKERKLKNVLKKLPGVAVDDKGNVTVQGQKVTKMLVDGKPFFGGNTKLAIDNIPADAIETIQAIKNYNEVTFLKNLTDSNKLAMNIALKKNKKRFVFGDVELGKGNQDFYQSNANLFYYAPKTNVNFIGSSNTTGKKIFTFQDYLSFQGGVNTVFSDNFDWKGGDFSDFLEQADMRLSKEHFAAINTNVMLSNTMNLSGFVIGSDLNTESLETNINEYPSFIEEQDNLLNHNRSTGISNLKLDYIPNEKEQWTFKTQIKRVHNNTIHQIAISVDTISNSIITDNLNTLSSVNKTVEWHKKGNSKHTYSAIGTYTFSRNIGQTIWNSDNPILNGLIPADTTQNSLRLNQHKSSEHHEASTIFKDFWVLHRNHHVYSTIGNSYTTQLFYSETNQRLDNNSLVNFSSAGFGNQFRFNFHDIFTGIHYKLRTGKFTFKQGGYLHRYSWNVDQEAQYEKSKWLFLPDFLMKVKFTKTRNFNVRYHLKANLPEIASLANGFYLQQYNSVFKGNEKLENELYHDFSMNYSQFSFYRGILLTANASYLKKVFGFNDAVVFNAINRVNTIELVPNVNDHWSLGAIFEKRINNIKYKVSGDYFGTRFLQKINQDVFQNKSHNYAYDLGIETLYESYPKLELGYRGGYGTYLLSNESSSFSNHNPYFKLSATFLKHFQWDFDYSYHHYENKSLNSKNFYQLANTSFVYQKEDNPWVFSIEAKNLWNTTFKRSNSFSNFLIQDTKTFVMPRVMLLSVAYKL